MQQSRHMPLIAWSFMQALRAAAYSCREVKQRGQREEGSENCADDLLRADIAPSPKLPPMICKRAWPIGRRIRSQRETPRFISCVKRY